MAIQEYFAFQRGQEYYFSWTRRFVDILIGTALALAVFWLFLHDALATIGTYDLPLWLLATIVLAIIVGAAAWLFGRKWLGMGLLFVLVSLIILFVLDNQSGPLIIA